MCVCEKNETRASTNRELDGLLRRDAHELGHESPVEAKDALVPDHLLEAVEAIGVEQLPDVGARPLVLHARLDQVDGVDGGGSGGARDGA